MKALDARSSKSSLRLNMFLTTVASLPIPIALAFYVIWFTFKLTPIEWAGWSLGVGAYAAFLYQMWYGKERNKKVEAGAGEISEEKPQGD